MTRNIVSSVIAAAVLMSACTSNVSGLKTAPINPNANSGNLTLKWVGNSTITIGINKNAIGKVQLLAGTDPVAGATISFAPDGVTGGAYLQSNTDTTDGDGYATVNILARDAATFRLGATTDGLSAPSYINVDVNGKYLGDVVVRANAYTGPAKPISYIVRLHNANTQGGGCATFRPDQIPPSIAEQQVANIQLDTLFANQQDKLSVYATIIGMSSTRPVVYGCGGPTTVLGQQRVTINVDLHTAEADLRGDYTFGQKIQPLAFLNQSSLLAVVLHDITAPFIDLGSFLTDGIWTMSANGGIGSGKGIGLCTLVAGSGQNQAVIDFCSQIGGEAIDVGLKALLGLDPTATNVYNDLHSGVGLLTDINVGGVMTIKDYQKSTGAVDGFLVYDSYRFVWTGACAGSTDICCGHTIYDGAKLGIQPFQAAFTGTATPISGAQVGYTFNTQPTELGLAYGRLAIAILEDVILPAIPGTSAWDTNGPNHSCTVPAVHGQCGDGKIQFGEIIAGLFSCSTTSGTAGSVCSQAAWAVGDTVDNLISQLQFNGTADWNIHEQIISGTMTDTDADLVPDTVTATLQMTADAAGNPTTVGQPFDARYKGTVCTGDGTCGNGYACHFAVNAVDGCFADNACGAAIGQYLGDTACSNDSDCKSGTCARATGVANATQPHAGYCFQACATDTDCLGNGHCDKAGYLSVSDTGSVKSFLDPEDVETITGMCVR